MFISKKHVSRGAVLKGAGVSIALPLLDAMIPAGTALAQTAAQADAAIGLYLFSARRRDDALDSGRRWQRLCDVADPGAARASTRAT